MSSKLMKNMNEKTVSGASKQKSNILKESRKCSRDRASGM